MNVFLLDNYDSFTYNLAQYLQELGAGVEVVRNDRTTPAAVLAAGFDAIVISPGPGRPEDAGITLALVGEAAGKIPLLGVCLGHQAIGAAWGASIVRARELVHGKTSEVFHDGRGVFAGLVLPIKLWLGKTLPSRPLHPFELRSRVSAGPISNRGR